MQQQTKARAWAQDLPTWPEKDQVEAIRAWCKQNGVAVTIYKASDQPYEKFERAVRRDMLAVFADLVTIVPPKNLRTKQPGRTLLLRVANLIPQVLAIVEIRSGARSDERAQWEQAHERAYIRATRGVKPLPSKRAREMWRKSRLNRVETSFDRWRGMKQRHESGYPEPAYEQARALYKSRAVPNAKAARDLLPEELRGWSRESLDRLFGGRN